MQTATHTGGTAAEAARLHTEHPDWSYTQIGEALGGISRQRVGQLLAPRIRAERAKRAAEERLARAVERGRKMIEEASERAKQVVEEAKLKASRARSPEKAAEIRAAAKERSAEIRAAAKKRAAELEVDATRGAEEARAAASEAAASEAKAAPAPSWSEETIALMEVRLRQGATALDLVSLPEVAARMPDRRDEEADARLARHATALRVLISRGKTRKPGEVARRLYDARQAGLAATAGEPKSRRRRARED